MEGGLTRLHGRTISNPQLPLFFLPLIYTVHSADINHELDGHTAGKINYHRWGVRISG